MGHGRISQQRFSRIEGGVRFLNAPIFYTKWTKETKKQNKTKLKNNKWQQQKPFEKM